MANSGKKKILLWLGHPNNDSLCGSLLDAYRKGAEAAGAEIRIIRLADLQFDPNLRMGFKGGQKLEPDLARFQGDLAWANHVVLALPLWWGSMPGALKGLIDRTFLPGFAFKYKENSPFQDKLLAGRSIRVLLTADSPNFWYNLVLGKPLTKTLKRQIFGFCGFKPMKTTVFGNVRAAKPEKIQAWLKQAELLGQNGG